MDVLQGYGSDGSSDNEISNDETSKDLPPPVPIKLPSTLSLQICAAPEVVPTVSSASLRI